MIDDDAIDQYNTEDYDAPQESKSTQMTLKRDQLTTEVRMGDQTFKIINPESLEFFTRKIVELESRCAKLENELQNVKQSARQNEAAFNNAIRQINTRFMFNG